MKKKSFVTILFGIIFLILIFVGVFKVYCYSNEYLYSVGRYQETVEGSAVRVNYGSYFEHGNEDYFVFMNTEDEDIFTRVESGDVVLVVHTSILVQDKCSTSPVHCIKVNKELFELFAK